MGYPSNRSKRGLFGQINKAIENYVEIPFFQKALNRGVGIRDKYRDQGGDIGNSSEKFDCQDRFHIT
ncbi:protein of unknown function [Methylocaldum szegediense]|uniref:Uncharacterized protein n=1 Tax=Methylocaldum szegediense TaxID=73780 RepID=A0ABN8WYK4_9GAMM|nr:protein of unknown function [Methylocaldum szegediense]